MSTAEHVPSALDGERLDRFLATAFDCSRSEASHAITAGDVLVDGKPALKSSIRVRENQLIQLSNPLHLAPQPPVPNPAIPIDVRYQDEHVIVLNKQAHLVVHAGPGHENDTLVNGLLAVFPEIAEVGDPARPGIVHRLDAGTSGLMMVARSPEAYDVLVDALREHRVQRVYWALVWGFLPTTTGVVDAPIARSRRDPLRMTTRADGKPARTFYALTSHVDGAYDLSQLRLQLETGRTHQIRVHMSVLGHPIVGDPTYGHQRPSLGIDRPALHAAELAFTHPITGESMTFAQELPADLSRLWERVGGASAPEHTDVPD